MHLYKHHYFEFIHSLHSHHLFMYLAKHDGYRRMVMHYMGYSGCLPLEMAMPSYCCYENFMTILYRVQTSAVHARMFLMIMKYSIKLYSHPALIPVSWGHKFMAITHHRHVSSTYTHIHGHHCHPFHHYHRHAHHHLHHHHHLHAHLPHYPCHPVSPMMHPF
ncbi:uncharacterized protein LOC142332186 [Lycorma delicatula]|uniref:uncharacterized protein LOC142332186 n=1 Tax=Lycorma delicatula TaxID=130591 RepID=UPI003F511FEA